MKSKELHTDEIREQARLIYETVRLLKTRIIAEHMSYVHTHACESGGMELTIPQMNMLSVIRDRQPITLKQIAHALHVSAPSASSMVDRLVEMGAVTREQNPVDRREVVVKITERAAAVLNDMEEHMLASVSDLLVRVGPVYARKWCEVYGHLQTILLAEIDEPDRPVVEGSAKG